MFERNFDGNNTLNKQWKIKKKVRDNSIKKFNRKVNIKLKKKVNVKQITDIVIAGAKK